MARLRNSTAIYRNSYNSKGLFPHRFLAGNSNLIKQEDGTLWALISRAHESCELFRSTDRGFTWQPVINLFDDDTWSDRDSSAPVIGAVQSLVVMEEWNLIIAFFSYRDSGGYSVMDYRWASLSADLTDPNSWTAPTSNMLKDINRIKQGMFKVVHHKQKIYVLYLSADVNTPDRLTISEMDVRNMNGLGVGTAFNGDTILPFWDACVDEDGKIDIVYAGSDLVIRHVRWNNGWGLASELSNMAQAYEATDLAIDKDGYGSLCASWGEAKGSDLIIKYAVWTGAWNIQTLARSSGHSAYVEPTTNFAVSRTDVLGSIEGGFVITYTERNRSGVPTPFLREVNTSDGVTYTLGEEKDITPYKTNIPTISGAKFFKPNGAQLQALDDKGLIRVAYLVGEGNTTTQKDRSPVHYDTELLAFSAYPYSPSLSYTTDERAGNQIRVNFNIVPLPSEDVDYYEEGAMGPLSVKYIKGFDKMGTLSKVTRYEPIQIAQMGDRSSYKKDSTHYVKAIFEPATYSEPTRQPVAENFDTYIERDIRKIKLPPDFYIARNWVLNDGNFLKRTVWLIEIDGNEYEITQVVPRFMNDQICFYEANAYVVGPSRDPFSRTILPSET